MLRAHLGQCHVMLCVLQLPGLIGLTTLMRCSPDISCFCTICNPILGSVQYIKNAGLSCVHVLAGVGYIGCCCMGCPALQLLPMSCRPSSFS